MINDYHTVSKGAFSNIYLELISSILVLIDRIVKLVVQTVHWLPMSSTLICFSLTPVQDRWISSSVLPSCGLKYEKVQSERWELLQDLYDGEVVGHTNFQAAMCTYVRSINPNF